MADETKKLREWWSVIGTFAALIGAGYVAVYRLGQAEARIDKIAQQVEVAAPRSELADIKDAVGRVQLDVAKMCVASFGIEKCATAGGVQ